MLLLYQELAQLPDETEIMAELDRLT